MATRTATKPKMSGTVYAYLSVLLFAIITPANKYLLNTTGIGSTMLAGFLYLGSGLGMTLLFAFRPKEKKALEKPLDRHDLPWIFLMIILDIGAAILTFWGTSLTAAGTAALLSNFELVVTALIAFLLFHEKISPRLWIAIALITLASILLSFEDGIYSLQFSPGALIMMAASACWGLRK
jgi:drug/metabolite transporter (DMT)-like permease